MISKDLGDFKARTEHLSPIVTEELYPKLVMLDKVIASGFDYMDFKALNETAQLFLRDCQQNPEWSNRRAQWVEDYRALTLGVGRQAATQAYITLEMDPRTTLVIFNNVIRAREIMLLNMAQLAQDGLHLFEAEKVMAGEVLFNGMLPVKNLVIYTDNEYKGVKRRDLFTKLEAYMVDIDSVRILELVTA